jgi:integrase
MGLWKQIDFVQDQIRILKAKSSSGERFIPMNAASRVLLGELARNAKTNLVFPSNRRVGERLLDLKKGFRKAVKSARIPPIRFHDLRHTFATRLIQSGVAITTVQRLLGHANISMTARYAHAPDSARVAAVKRLDELFAPQPDPNRPPEANVEDQVVVYKPQQVNTIGP